MLTLNLCPLHCKPIKNSYFIQFMDCPKSLHYCVSQSKQVIQVETFIQTEFILGTLTQSHVCELRL